MKKIIIVLLIFGGLIMVNHQNFIYGAGPTFPITIGDRYYAQDLARDYWSKIDDAGKKVASGFNGFPVLLKNANVTKGTLYTDIDIPIAKGIVLYEVDVPNSYAALPPTVTQEDVYCRIVTTAQTDFDISGTATLDGATTNYVKVTYNETDGSSRTRAKKAGTYVYEKAVSFTITVDDVAPTDYDLVLATLVGDGATTLVIDSYTRTSSYNSEYDYVVSTQEDFNILIDYTAANQYRIKDNIKSVFVKSLSGGYQMTGATSPLQEGDVDGAITTNDCTRLVFEPGAFIDMHQGEGYLEIDTDYCYLDGVSIRGDTGAAATIVRTFLLNANYVTFQNCSTMDRLSDGIVKVFEGSSTAFHNQTAKYNNCTVAGYETSLTITCFYNCQNLNNITIYDVEGTVDVIGVYGGTNINNININTLVGGGCAGISGCTDVNNVKIENFSCMGEGYGLLNSSECSDIDITDITAAQQCIGIRGCNMVSDVYIYDLECYGNSPYYVCGVYLSSIISNCKIMQLDSTGTGAAYGFRDCSNVSNNEIEDIDSVSGAAYGLNGCIVVTGCNVSDIDSFSGNYHGFYDCTNITACFAGSCENGFNICAQISGSQAQNNDNDGFFDCNRISACIGNGNGNDGYEDCTVISACLATGNTGNGFDNCKNMTANRSTANTAANYLNSTADWAGLNACADTQAGGFNS